MHNSDAHHLLLSSYQPITLERRNKPPQRRSLEPRTHVHHFQLFWTSVIIGLTSEFDLQEGTLSQSARIGITLRDIGPGRPPAFLSMSHLVYFRRKMGTP